MLNTTNVKYRITNIKYHFLFTIIYTYYIMLLYNDIKKIYKINVELGYEKKTEDIFNGIVDKCENDDGEELRIFGVYYGKKIKNIELMIEYYKKAIDLNNAKAMFGLGNYYEQKKDYENMLIYYEAAIDNNHVKAMYRMGVYYDEIDCNIEKSILYYRMAADNGHVESMLNVGIQYKEKEDYDNMKIYLLKAIENDNTDAMNILAIYYSEIEIDYEESIKFYKKAIELGNSIAMFNLGYHHRYTTKNYNEMKKYFTMSIEKGYEEALDELDEYFDNDIKLYNCLKELKKNKIINDKIEELELTNEIIKYKNKINLFKRLKNYKRCSICLEDDVLNINLGCGHEICFLCYADLDKCYYNFCKINK